MKYFQIIDNKSKCPNVYFDGHFQEGIPDETVGTWAYSTAFRKNLILNMLKYIVKVKTLKM